MRTLAQKPNRTQQSVSLDKTRSHRADPSRKRGGLTWHGFGRDFSNVPAHASSSGDVRTRLSYETEENPNEMDEACLSIQKRSLELTSPMDADEREAEEVARKVVEGRLVRIPAAGGTLQGKTESSVGSASEFQSKLDRSKGNGQSLDASTRNLMTSRMGVDFREVKIHAGGIAHDMSESLGAQAFTHGRDVYFNVGKFSPETRDGKELLAHELTHTVQQQSAARLQLQKKDKVITIVVKKGQNLYRIALEYGTTVEELQKLNKLATPNIKEGQTLKVPKKTSAENQIPKAPKGKHELDDIYGDLKRPHYGDYSITKADLEKNIPYKDPVSGTSYPCQVKETFFGIWVSHAIDYAQKGAHAKGRNKYGTLNAFAATIPAPGGALLFFSADEWSALSIEEKVRAYDNHPSWDLCPDLKYKIYPKLNAEFERRVKLHKMDSATAIKTLCQ